MTEAAASVGNDVRLVRVAITQGDTNGVGYEVILKTFSDASMLDLCVPIIYGHAKVAAFHKKALGLDVPLYFISAAEEAMPGRLNFVNCSEEEVKVDFGVPTPDAGHAALLSLERAVDDVKRGQADVLVTAPINKSDIQGADFHFVGHTEYLQSCFAEPGRDVLMILCNSLMRVALATTHLPLSAVASSMTQPLIEEKIRLFSQTLRRDFCVSAPRVALLALNPHAGDGGLLGREEQNILLPAVQSLSENGVDCFGPYAADGFFGAGLYSRFDGVLALYHDQGLAPFKALDTGEGINFTAGLPIVRTSPDHGTAYDIAGQGKAVPTSFRHAVFEAIDIYRHRTLFDAASENPLPKLYHDRKEASDRQPRTA